MNNSMASPDAFAKAIETLRDALEENKPAMSSAAVKSAQEFLSAAQKKLTAFGNATEVNTTLFYKTRKEIRLNIFSFSFLFLLPLRQELV